MAEEQVSQREEPVVPSPQDFGTKGLRARTLIGPSLALTLAASANMNADFCSQHRFNTV